MAVLAAAALLDELMGRNRNIAPNDKTKELNWEDPEYCKLYMVRFCPHDLFVNTRADLGQCPKVHDDEVKGLFEKSNSYKKQQYEDEFIRFCQSMLNEVERKIVKGKQRLALIGKADAISLSPAQTQKNEEQIKFLTEKINSLVAEAEQMGIQGNVEQAQGLMKLCDQLKEEREQLRGNNENSHWQQTAELAAAQEKQMEVCDVCGAFLIVGDAQQRIDDHLMGKQHVGYARLKMAMEELMNNRQKNRDDKERRRDEERRERSRVREEEERKRSRERDRDREREERRRKREEEEKRSKVKHRSKSPRSFRPRSLSRSRSRTRRNSRERDLSRRGGKSADERGKFGKPVPQRNFPRGVHCIYPEVGGPQGEVVRSGRSRSRSKDRHRDHKRKGGDEYDRDHHRRSNKERGGLNGDYGRHSSPSHRSSGGRQQLEPRSGRSSLVQEPNRADE